MGKRRKVQCESCGSIFNNDFQKKHENALHGGKRVKIKVPGAPANPFVASMSSNMKSNVLENVNSELASTTNVLIDKNDVSTVASINVNDVSHDISNGQHINLLENVNLKCLPSTTSESKNSKTNDLTNSVLNCAGQFRYLFDYIKLCKPIIHNFQESEVLNAYKIVVEIKEAIDNIIKISNSVLEKCNDVTTQLESQSGNASEVEVIDSVVEHDPGKRTNIISDNQRQYLVMLGPHQPKLNVYPRTAKYSFKYSWFEEFPHLEYSIVKDAAFCYVCYLFPRGVGREKSENNWTVIGVKNWKKMKGNNGTNNVGKLKKHFGSETHKAALYEFCHFMNKNNHIDIMLDKNKRQKIIQEERDRAFHTEVISILLDVAKTLGRQNLAFRGHANDENGNFKQIIYLISRHCPLLREWLDSSRFRPYHTNYMSPKSQNEFINILGSSIKSSISKKVNDARQFAVMADTTPDLSHKDILSVVVRFVNDKGKPEERLLEVREIVDKTGKGMANEILDTLRTNNLDLQNLVFQSYDFANNMSGQFNGAQQKISEAIGRKIPYIPCNAHRINTFIEHACDSSLIVSDLFSIVQELYVFFSSSTKRYGPLLNKLNEIENSLKLRNLSQTRWTARAEALKSLWTSYPIIIDNIMYKLKLLTECLESVELNITDATLFISSTLKSLDIINSDSENMDNLIQSAVVFLKKYEVDAEKEFSVRHRRRIAPKNLDSNRSNASEFSFHSFYRKEFKMVLDKLNGLIKDHLEKSINDIKPLYSMFKPPFSKELLTETLIQDAIQFLPNNVEIDPLTVQCELEVLYDQCQNKSTMSDLAIVSHELKTALPLANLLCRLSCTAPVTVAGNERSFSKLKTVKNYLRTTQEDSRLNNLMLLSSEKDLVDKISLNEMAQKWFNDEMAPTK
ncbi:zinc finger MYM-type protein 1-like [Rhopalosiphum padi]|uniref:zinc finger MYM-type protein 1-like n=1 Tax=Rhopalosiphum padi TaxID=40932 RepID=UPI00298EA8F3|nr:zinc finger MYM-type protein 1-like [Rhopalosiphum padi]